MQGFLDSEEAYQDMRDANKTSLHKNSEAQEEAEDIDKEVPGTG